MDSNVETFKMPEDVEAAIELLLKHARGDYGGAGRCAMFLLLLWDGESFRVDLQDLM